MITENMRLFGVALAAAENKYRDQGYSAHAAAVLALTDAAEQVPLTPAELLEVGRLIGAGRLGDLAS